MGTITSTQNANQFVGLSWLEWFEIYPYIWLLPGNVLQQFLKTGNHILTFSFLYIVLCVNYESFAVQIFNYVGNSVKFATYNNSCTCSLTQSI